MHAALPLLLSSALVGLAAEQLPNLNFGEGDLQYWEGAGFSATPSGVSSFEAKGQALLYRTITVPPQMAAIRFAAGAGRPAGTRPGPILDIYLEGTERRLIPKQVRAGDAWKPASALLSFPDGEQREYQWDLAGLEGETVRIVLLDQDDRPGCYVACAGFHLVPRAGTALRRLALQDGAPLREFTDFMVTLARDHHLTPFSRYDSKHFTALSNVDDEYVEHRLYNCEAIYDLFYPHFRERGFNVYEPRTRLMVAIFDSQAGFEAYLGHDMSTAITGIYHPPTNRLVVYDYAGNRAFAESKKKSEQQARQIKHDLSRQRYLGSFSRKFADYRNDLNVGTIMHEVAHQLSFNGGLLNRQGDAPLWLVEGLATYCEPTNQGSWAGIGEPNPARAGTLASAIKKGTSFITLRNLVASDDWLRKSHNVGTAALGYAQSWALFRMLIEERPRDLKRYLAVIYPRRTPDHRLTDFVACFGGNLDRLERQYVSYVRKVAAVQALPLGR